MSVQQQEIYQKLQNIVDRKIAVWVSGAPLGDKAALYEGLDKEARELEAKFDKSSPVKVTANGLHIGQTVKIKWPLSQTGIVSGLGVYEDTDVAFVKYRQNGQVWELTIPQVHCSPLE